MIHGVEQLPAVVRMPESLQKSLGQLSDQDAIQVLLKAIARSNLAKATLPQPIGARAEVRM